MRVIIKSETIFFVQTFCILGRMGSKVQLRGVLHDQNGRMFVDSSLGRLHMGLQNLVGFMCINNSTSASKVRYVPADTTSGSCKYSSPTG